MTVDQQWSICRLTYLKRLTAEPGILPVVAPPCSLVAPVDALVLEHEGVQGVARIQDGFRRAPPQSATQCPASSHSTRTHCPPPVRPSVQSAQQHCFCGS